MYDTIHLFISERQLNDRSFMQTIPLNLVNLNEHYNIQSDTISFSGTIDNYRVDVAPWGIKLKGSLQKFVLGEANIFPLTKQDVKQGINKLSDILKINVENALITRLDFGINIQMEQNVTEYFPLLLDVTRMKRFLFPTTLDFRNKTKQLSFYDKTLELEKRKIFAPENLLRYEVRYLRKVNMQCQFENLYLILLSKPSFFDSIRKKLLEEYKSVQKNIDYNAIPLYKNTKELMQVILAAGVRSMTLNAIVDDLRTKQRNKTISHLTVNRSIKKLMNFQGLKEESHFLLTELETKLVNAIS